VVVFDHATKQMFAVHWVDTTLFDGDVEAGILYHAHAASPFSLLTFACHFGTTRYSTLSLSWYGSGGSPCGEESLADGEETLASLVKALQPKNAPSLSFGEVSMSLVGSGRY